MPRTATVGRRNFRHLASIALAVALATLLSAMSALPAYEGLRERAFDAMLGAFAAKPVSTSVVIVDIDRRALERFGAWPWSRERIAALIDRVAEAKPSAIGLDILIEGEDLRSPAALARQLAASIGKDAISGLSERLPDGDRLMATAASRGRVVLGAALDPGRRPPPPIRAPPLLATGGAYLSDVWEAPGLIAPPPAIARAAAGLGVIALAADSDGRVRRVPLMTRVGTEFRPGIAVEVVRMAQRASSYLLLPNGWLRTGNVMVPVEGGMLRLLPGPEPDAGGRSISAADVEQAGTREQLANRIVLIGGSAPELGGLRTTSYGRLRPSVEIQADAVSQMLTGASPRRPTVMLLIELAACLIVGIGAFIVVHWLRPVSAALSMLAAGIGWLVLAAMLVAFGPLLLDPLAAPATGLVSYGIAMLFAASETRRREDALRRSFEQHLAPELVSRIVSDPGLVKLAGEQRVVTILFTDIEGFTAMTERTEPADLIAALDRYFEALSSIVVGHGGMVEKVVGDGVHALFNAPLDLPDHPDKAVDCAVAIQNFSVAFASEPRNAALAFGRTRIGVETGPVIVGDVGGGARLDYTAYGNAMNTAARLEAANKVTGTSICIGEATAALLADRDRLRPLGTLELRGLNEQLEVFDVWPPDMTEDQRVRYTRACTLLGDDPQRAIEMLRVIADERPLDMAISCLIERYGTGVLRPEPK